MSVEIITKEDLREFRNDLLNDIRALLNTKRPERKEWMKAGEVKKLLNISSGTLLTLRAKGQLQFSKIGGTYYYRDEDVQRMLINGSHNDE